MTFVMQAFGVGKLVLVRVSHISFRFYHQGSIAGWKKAVGDKISAGDILCDIQTVRAL